MICLNFLTLYLLNIVISLLFVIYKINKFLFYHVGSFIFLFLENYGVRKLEALFGILVGTMAVSFAIIFGETKPSGKELLVGSYFLQLN